MEFRDCFLRRFTKLLRAVPVRAVGILLTAATATICNTAHAQTDTQSSLGQQLEILDNIDAIELAEGPNTELLIGPLSELAIALDEEGDAVAAASVVERIRQIIRVNYGPHSLRQAPFIKQLVEYLENDGDFRNAWALENELLNIALRDPENIESVPILHEIGDKRMNLFREFASGETPPQIYIGCYFDWTKDRSVFGECMSGSRGEAMRAVNSDAQRIYASAVTILLNNDAYSSDELHELEAKFLQSNYAYRDIASWQGLNARNPFPLTSIRWNSRMESVYDLADWEFPESYFQSPLEQAEPRQRDGNRGTWHQMNDRYFVGRLSLQRQLAYLIESASPLSEQAEAVVNIADWDLLHGRNALGIQGYALAWRQLQTLDSQSGLVESLFLPETPVMLPTFAPNPLATDPTLRDGAYIEVQFELSRFGRGRNVRVLGISADFPESARNERSRLVRRIKDAHFRPQTATGRFSGSPPIVARYYLPDSSAN